MSAWDEPPLEDNPEMPGPKAQPANVPQNIDAERAVLGGLVNGQAKIGAVIDQLDADDFYLPAHGHLYHAIVGMHRAGSNVTPVLVRAELNRLALPVTDEVLIACQAQGTGIVNRYVALVVNASIARKVLMAVENVSTVAKAGTMDGLELVDLLREAAAGIDAPPSAGQHFVGLDTVDRFLETADLSPSPWVIPGLLRSGWRALVVAPEGVGKSVASRQLAIAAAQGVHPFRHTRITPVRTLIVDLENPDDAIADTCKPITSQARAVSADYQPDRAWLWRRPEGIDVRSRAGRVALERTIAAVQPDLVCLGPLYKAYNVKARENDELAAGEVQRVLDDLRTRYKFALLMEHHAPKATGLSVRDLVPYGSSLWLRWPELGLTLIPGNGETAKKDSLVVGRFRRDRMTNAWPDRLDRGGAGRWPWVGYWENGQGDDL